MAFLLFGALGYSVSIRSWNGVVFVFLSEDRRPASLDRSQYYSELESDALGRLSHRRLLEKAKLHYADEAVGFEFGHFVATDAYGRRLFACDLYPRIELIFEVEGQATHGEKPSMTIGSDCVRSSDVSRLETIWIPFEWIRAEGLAQGEWTFRGDSELSIRLHNLDSSWPDRWTLKTVRLSHPQKPDAELSVTPGVQGPVLDVHWPIQK